MISFITRKLYDNHISENKIDIGKKGKRSKWHGAVRETYLQSFNPDSGIAARTTNRLLLRFEFNIRLLPLLKVRFFYRIFVPLLNALLFCNLPKLSIKTIAMQTYKG